MRSARGRGSKAIVEEADASLTSELGETRESRPAPSGKLPAPSKAASRATTAGDRSAAGSGAGDSSVEALAPGASAEVLRWERRLLSPVAASALRPPPWEDGGGEGDGAATPNIGDGDGALGAIASRDDD